MVVVDPDGVSRLVLLEHPLGKQRVHVGVGFEHAGQVGKLRLGHVAVVEQGPED
jgi:hypothetical protein